ncbi:MAG: sodium:proton antiporter, partial [Tabrizicola sp.]
WIGKPLGMLVLGLGTIAVLGLKLPPGISLRDILRVVVVLAPGFTVPVLALDSALPGGAMQEAARMGLAISLLAGAQALLLPPGRRPRWRKVA